MMTTLENVIQKSITRSRRSVHHTGFLWASCQGFFLSTTHRKPALSGAHLHFSRITPINLRSSSSRRVTSES